MFEGKKLGFGLMRLPLTDANDKGSIDIEALKEIRKLSADIPIIMQTAYAFDSDKDIAIEAGCTGFITKPINPVVLKQTISNYISGIIW